MTVPQQKNRLEHLRRIFEQVIAAKVAQPNATPENLKPISDTLLDAIAEILALSYGLEEGKKVSLANLTQIMKGLQQQYLIYKEGKPIPRLSYPTALLPAPQNVPAAAAPSATTPLVTTRSPLNVPNATTEVQPKSPAQGVTNVKVNIAGRPDSVAEKGDQVTLIMRYTPKLPAGLPKGVPQPSGATTTYRVFVGKKQWNKVSKVMVTPDDSLLIEGTGLLEADAPSMISVYATNISSKLDKIALAEQQKVNVLQVDSSTTDATATENKSDQL